MMFNIRIVRDALDRPSLVSILLMSILTSSLTLVIPIAAQTLMNFVAFGKVFRPVITICIIVFIFMVGNSILTIWQAILIEMLQQRFLVITSLRMAKKLIFVSQNSLNQEHTASLVNRFFEIITIRKAIATLLLNGFDMGLQLIFGLVLLIIYHPLFVFFDLFILVSLTAIIAPIFKKSSTLAEKECTQKHMLGGWLEDILEQRSLFQFNHHGDFALKKTDKKIISYLASRRSYFKQLIRLNIGLHGLITLATVMLLGMGCYLVIINQLSPGQLVASELILGAMLASFKRLPSMMENFYDMNASIQKIQHLLRMPDEGTALDGDTNLFTQSKTFILQFKQFIVAKHHESIESLPLNGMAQPKSPLVVHVQNHEDGHHLLQSLLGQQAFEGEILLNDVPCSLEMLSTLRRETLYIHEPTWFTGTIQENLLLNHKRRVMQSVLPYLDQFHLLEKIYTLPEKFETYITNPRAVFSEEELLQLMLIRAALVKPKLLLLEGTLDGLSEQMLGVAQKMLSGMSQTTVIITSVNPKVHDVLMRHS